MVNIAIIGDIHLHFSEEDVKYFNQANYDLILIVGDLSNYLPGRGYRLARTISQLNKPALFIPGNHDTVNLFQLLAEIKGRPTLTKLFSIGQASRAGILEKNLDTVQFGGYSTHAYRFGSNNFDVIVARPYSMGGPALNFTPYLRRRFGVDSMESSARLLKEQVDKSRSEDLIFLAHNGPYGLGSGRSDIWGCDFLEEEVDFGDRDLSIVIEYARSKGKRVLAVIAGHMHHEIKGGGRRRWCVEKDGICYVNAARVPRIFLQEGRQVRHHVALSIDDSGVAVREQLV